MEKENFDVKHDGHRIRLSELVSKVGPMNVSDIQSIEDFLFYIIPRKDVNPLAHRLLDKYGNFANILDADVNELSEIKGLGRHSATKIKNFKNYIELYFCQKASNHISFDNSKEFLDFLETILSNKTTENLFIFCINNNWQLTKVRKYEMDFVRSVGIPVYELLNIINAYNPAYIALAHNHPGGSARPSQTDIDAVEYISKILNGFECELVDNFILGIDGIYSEMQGGFVRKYDAQTII